MGDKFPKQEEMQFKFGSPKKEIDEPLDLNRSDHTPEQLTTKELEIAEKDKDRREKRYFSAFKLIVGCLIFLGVIYIVEVIVSGVLYGEASDSTGGIIEIIKTLLFTLSGYLFARKENGD